MDQQMPNSFESLKTAITTTLALSMPTPDDLFHLETDGSGIGIGAVLSQKQDDCWHPIAYISKSLSDAEQNYHATDLEMAAVIFALTKWQHYLLGATHPFKVLTDHQNLTYILPQTPRSFLSTSLMETTYSGIPLILCPGGQTMKGG